MERVDPAESEAPDTEGTFEKLTTAKLAAKLGMSTKDLFDKLLTLGLVEVKPEHPNRHYITPAGKQAGGEWRPGAGGGYLLWPASLQLTAR